VHGANRTRSFGEIYKSDSRGARKHQTRICCALNVASSGRGRRPCARVNPALRAPVGLCGVTRADLASRWLWTRLEGSIRFNGCGERSHRGLGAEDVRDRLSKSRAVGGAERAEASEVRRCSKVAKIGLKRAGRSYSDALVPIIMWENLCGE
jgi:hypothetical protein